MGRERESKMVNDRRNLGAVSVSQIEEQVRKRKTLPERFLDMTTSLKNPQSSQEWGTLLSEGLPLMAKASTKQTSRQLVLDRKPHPRSGTGSLSEAALCARQGWEPGPRPIRASGHRETETKEGRPRDLGKPGMGRQGG